MSLFGGFGGGCVVSLSRCDCGRFANLGDKNSIQMDNFVPRTHTRTHS